MLNAKRPFARNICSYADIQALIALNPDMNKTKAQE